MVPPLGAHLAMRWHERHRGEPLAEPFPRERCEGLQQFATMQALDNAMGRLSDKHRMALEQRFRAGLEGAALADVLHVSEDDLPALMDAACEALDKQLAADTAVMLRPMPPLLRLSPSRPLRQFAALAGPLYAADESQAGLLAAAKEAIAIDRHDQVLRLIAPDETLPSLRFVRAQALARTHGPRGSFDILGFTPGGAGFCRGRRLACGLARGSAAEFGLVYRRLVAIGTTRRYPGVVDFGHRFRRAERRP